MKKQMLSRLLAVALMAASVILAYAQAPEDIAAIPSCPYCGMDRLKFAHSRVLIEYEDGTRMGVCSLHCAAIDLSLNIDKAPRTIWVADYNSKRLVDAEKAAWVMDPAKPGVMTRTAKWAFEKNDDALKFTQENGGRLAAFEESLQAAYQDMYADVKMIREKRKAMKMKQAGHKAQ